MSTTTKSRKVSFRLGTSLDEKPNGVEVQGRTFDGILAFHRTTDAKTGEVERGDWRVTHVPTGFAFPISGTNEKETRALALALASVDGADWSFDNANAVKEWSVGLRERLFEAAFAALPSLLRDGPYARRKLGLVGCGIHETC